MSPAAPVLPKRCPSCAGASPEEAMYCIHCGGALPASSPSTAVSGGPLSSWDWDRIRTELVAGFRRFWPALLLIGFAAIFDYRLKGQLWFTILAGGGASLALLLFTRFRRFIEPVTALIPQRFVGPALTAVPAAFLYLARWKGTQSDGSALLTAAAILGFAFLVATYRQQLNERLMPFFQERNRLLPRPVRFILVFAIPVLLTFLLVHRDLGDIGALFGGTTSSPRAPTGGNTSFMIILTAVLSASAVFLLLNEPSSRQQRSAEPRSRDSA